MIDRTVELAEGINHSCPVYLYCYMPCDVVLIDGSSGSQKRIGYYTVQFFAEQEHRKVLEVFRWMKLRDIVNFIRFHIQKTVCEPYITVSRFGVRYRYQRHLLFAKFRHVRLNKGSDLRIVKHDVSSLVRRNWRLFRTYSYYRQSVAGFRKASRESWI